MIIEPALDKNGNRQWDVTTGPTTEPITTTELKTFARIDGTEEDDFLEGVIQSVREAMERYLGRALLEQTITLTMDYWPSMVIELPMPPLISVTSVATLDEDDTATSYSSDNYYVRTTALPGQLVLKQSVSAPYNTDRTYGGYRIIYVAGYGDEASDVPRAIRDSLLIWASIIYETRTMTNEVPSEVVSLLENSYRVYQI